MKKALTIEDLVLFCEKNNFDNFDSKKTGFQLSVLVPATFEESEYEDNTLLYGKVKLFHIGLNRNGSNVTEDAANKSLSTIKYKPLLADFCEIDGERDFTSHAMTINEDGSINYIEHQIGCFTADEPYIEHDDETDKDFIFANVAIPREYTDAADIIERKHGTKISVELLINKMSWNAKEKTLDLEDITVQGATCLGKNPETGEDIEEGMKGARLDIADFSIQNNSLCEKFDSNDKLIEMLEAINLKIDELSSFTIEKREKGGKTVVKIEEMLEKYGKTTEDIDFDYSEMTEAEISEKLEEIFGEKDPEPKDPETDPEGDPDPAPEEKSFVKYSITSPTGDVKEFELSLDDIQYALSSLVNETYSDEDGCWYFTTVYEKHLIMEDFWTGKAYRQTYEREGDNFSLTGDRVEVFKNWLSKDEEAELNQIRSNYEAVSSELSRYKDAEEKAKKDELFKSSDYAMISENESFVNLMSEKDNYSYDELKEKADNILLACAKANTLKFSVDPTVNQTPKKNLVNNSKKAKKNNRYGTLKFN